MIKIAVCGSTCAGKTTLCHLAVGLLKAKGINAEYVGNLTRRMPFSAALLDDRMSAQYHVIFQHLAEESAAMLRSDMQVLVCDRSPYDYLLYAEVTALLVDRSMPALVFESTRSLVERWLETYSLLYFLDAGNVRYIRDGKRPTSTNLRDKVNDLYKERMQALRMPFETLTGTAEKRAARIVTDVRRLLK